MSSAPDLTSRLLRHERLVVAGGIALLAGLAWWFVIDGAGMPGSGGMAAMAPVPLPALVLMWWVMMVAMMLPSAAPAILLYSRVRAARRGDAAIAGSWVFMAGYAGVWLLFSLAAALAEHWLTGPSMRLDNRRTEALLLVAAGLYQLSPVKGACLRQCRTPAQFISRNWRPGTSGAVRLGMLHGAYCAGCCWMLMALLFVGGIMNLMWIAALAGLVAIEKLAPRGLWIGQVTGFALILWAAARLAG